MIDIPHLDVCQPHCFCGKPHLIVEPHRMVNFGEHAPAIFLYCPDCIAKMLALAEEMGLSKSAASWLEEETCRQFSEELFAHVVEKMRQKGIYLSIHSTPEGYTCEAWHKTIDGLKRLNEEECRSNSITESVFKQASICGTDSADTPISIDGTNSL